MTEKVTFRSFDAAEWLDSEEAIGAFLADSAETGDPAVMLGALATVARARDMSALAKAADISRSGLYKALSSEGNPSFVLVDKIAKAMGYRVSLVPIVELGTAFKRGTKKPRRVPQKTAREKIAA